MLGSFREFLNEMFVHRLSPVDAASTEFLAFRSHLWLFKYDDKNAIQTIASTIAKEHPKAPQGLLDVNYADQIRDYVPDTVSGSWHPKDKSIWLNNNLNISPKTSPLMKKVMDTLGARSVKYSPDDDRNVKIGRKRIKGDWGQTAYHGTTSRYLEDILVSGLEADRNDSNWSDQGIYHTDRVFLTHKLEEAQFHATELRAKEIVKEYLLS